MNARMVLPMMAGEYFAAGRKMVAANREPKDLHPFRLATKRFRYTLEIFRDVYGPAMADRLKQLKPVQDALGAVNDCVATREEFDSDRKFCDYLERRAVRKARDFYKSWINEFDAPGQEERWIRFLSRVPKPLSSKAKATVHSDDLAGQEIGARK
jgi:CHAD domain-containing protein